MMSCPICPWLDAISGKLLRPYKCLPVSPQQLSDVRLLEAWWRSLPQDLEQMLVPSLEGLKINQPNQVEG